MTKITLELPPELAQKLQQLDQAELVTTLEKVLGSREQTTMKLLPAAPLPEKTFKISREAWCQQLLKMPAWDAEALRDIEEARAYINQWQPKTSF